MTDYAELKRLAELATPGPWQAYDTYGKRFIESMVDELHVVSESPRKQWLKDSEFISAANPAAVLALIAENERSKEKYAEAGRLYLEMAAERDHLKSENERLRNENADALAVNLTIRQQLDCYVKDAERYRFLRDQPSCYMHTEGWQIRRHWKDQDNAGRPHGMNTMCVSGESLDNGIDAAIGGGRVEE